MASFLDVNALDIPYHSIVILCYNLGQMVLFFDV